MYSAYDREHLAIYAAVRIFRHMLEARHFTILTDHTPLTFSFQQKRQMNHVDYISQIATDIHHKSGQDIVADALSRVEPTTAPLNRDGLAAVQDGDEKLRTLRVCNRALQLEKLLIPGTSIQLFCNTPAVKPCPYVPSPLRRQVFDSHNHL
jgi:cleavage and polyadenylation specificity factor subunit 1